MSLRSGGQALSLDASALRASFPSATGKLLVLVHGSCMADRGWLRKGHDHGAALARDLGYTPVYLHYNSGLHISDNGRAFAALLEQLCSAWPVPITELCLLGHSMGGLVARSACHVAETNGLGWRPLLRKLVCLGTPHHGSPVERGGSLVHALIGISRYSAPIARLAQIRSAGVTDLRFGYVSEEHWQGSDRFARGKDQRRALALPAGVDCFAMAASVASDPRASLPGDGLVPVDSALGRHAQPELTLQFPEAHTWVALGTGHLDLLDRPSVYQKLEEWLA
jgi:pimeloyl-ACP methyl ester carboxylesterase